MQRSTESVAALASAGRRLSCDRSTLDIVRILLTDPGIAPLGRVHAGRHDLTSHPPRSAKGRGGSNEYNSQTSAPGSEATAKARPKQTEKSSAFSGAMP